MTTTTTNSDTDLEEIVRAAHKWRILIDQPDATEMDLLAFEAWLEADPRHEELFGRAETFWNALGDVSEAEFDARLFKLTLYERLARALASCFARPYLHLLASGSVAAALAFAALPTINWGEPKSETIAERPLRTSYSTAIGETRNIQLSDGSAVSLGAASEITTELSATTRKVELISGVAFFDIASITEIPFLVIADDLTVTVTGTAFEVRRSNDTLRVSVAEGDVAVSYPFAIDNKLTSLIGRRQIGAAQQVYASPQAGMQPTRSVLVSAVGAWREDRLVYDGDPLEYLIADANRYSAKRVLIEGDVERISGLRIRGAFSRHDIDGMLSTLALIHPLEVDRTDPDIIKIRSTADKPN